MNQSTLTQRDLKTLSLCKLNEQGLMEKELQEKFIHWSECDEPMFSLYEELERKINEQQDNGTKRVLANQITEEELDNFFHMIQEEISNLFMNGVRGLLEFKIAKGGSFQKPLVTTEATVLFDLSQMELVSINVQRRASILNDSYVQILDKEQLTREMKQRLDRAGYNRIRRLYYSMR